MPDLSKLSNEELLKLDEATRQANNAEVFAQAGDKPEASPLQTALEQKIIERNDPGLLDTILRGAGNTLNLGFGDNLRAGVKTGFGLFGDYGQALEEDRAKYAGGKAAHPVAALASEIGGAVGSAMVAPELQLARGTTLGKTLLPNMVLPRVIRSPAASIPERLNRAGTTGLIYGGISGAGESNADNPLDMLKGAGIGAGAGAVLGPAISGLGSAIGAGVRQLGSLRRGAFTPENEAQQRVAMALQQDRVSRDVAAGLPPKADEAVQEAQQQLGTAIDRGTPMIVADTGGETTRALARSAANTSPVAREALHEATNSRFASQTPRTTAFLQGATGAGGDTTAVRESLQAAARRANRPAYQRAYAEGESGVWNDQLQGLTAAPAVQDAMRGAVKTGANKAAADGFRPPRNPFVEAQDGTLQLAPGTRPTLQFWDHVKRNLDDAINGALDKRQDSHARDLQDLRTTLLQQLDAASPSYRGARQGAAGFFGMENAMDVGTLLATDRKININDVARGIAGMNEAERRLTREGYVNKMMDEVSQMRNRADISGHPLFTTPEWFGARSRMILGADQAGKLEDFMRVETIMNRTRQAVQSGSPTARLWHELGMAGGPLGVGAVAGYVGGFDPSDPSSWMAPVLIAGAARIGKGKIDQRVVEQVGRLLASNDPQKLNQGLRIVARNQSLRNALQRGSELVQRAFVTSPERPGLQQ